MQLTYYSTARHGAAQHSRAQHSTALHSTALHSRQQHSKHRAPHAETTTHDLELLYSISIGNCYLPCSDFEPGFEPGDSDCASRLQCCPTKRPIVIEPPAVLMSALSAVMT